MSTRNVSRRRTTTVTQKKRSPKTKCTSKRSPTQPQILYKQALILEFPEFKKLTPSPSLSSHDVPPVQHVQVPSSHASFSKSPPSPQMNSPSPCPSSPLPDDSSGFSPSPSTYSNTHQASDHAPQQPPSVDLTLPPQQQQRIVIGDPDSQESSQELAATQVLFVCRNAYSISQ